MILYLSGMVLMAVVRKYFTDQFARQESKKEVKSGWDTTLLVLIGVSMFLPMVSYLTDWIAFADRSQATTELVFGVMLNLVAAWLLYRSHKDLDRHWTMSVGIRHDHQLVTKGIYQTIRHPMYSAHLLWGLAVFLIVPNWISGSMMLMFTSVFAMVRIPAEENMLLEEFGEDYRTYMKKTGRLLPKISGK